MSSTRALQPFDRHPADIGALEHGCAGLTLQAGRAVDPHLLTILAFLPAMDDWDGIAAPELRAAPRPVREQAFHLNDSLVWAATAVACWLVQVKAFNHRVEQISMGLNDGKARLAAASDPAGQPPSIEEIVAAQQALEAPARKLWWRAYETHVVGGGRIVARMLDDGPTTANVATARSIGLVPPGQPWNALGPITALYRQHGVIPASAITPSWWPAPNEVHELPLGDETVPTAVARALDEAQIADVLRSAFRSGLARMLGGMIENR
jgi:hypothetical protein